MKKILFIIFLIFLMSIQAMTAFADEKISSVNFDTSSNMLFIASNSDEISTKPVKLVKLSNPNRVYFDIENAILIGGKQDYQISSGGILRQVIVSQNSTSPNVVRVVLYFAESYNVSDLKLKRFKGNIIAEFNKNVCLQSNYMQTIFRDEKYEKSDFFEFVNISSQNITAVNRPLTTEGSDKVINQIQRAFENSTVPATITSSYQNANVSVVKKEMHLKTKFYLNNITAKPNGILLSGFGSFSMEKPIKLSSPDRFVLDLPNTLTNPNLRTKTFKYGTSSIRIGQFEANKARIVINTDNADKFLPIFSADNQTLLIADKEVLQHDKLTNISTNLTSSKFSKVNEQNYGVNFYFSRPVIYSVKQDLNKLTIYFFNAVQYNDQDFKLNLKNTELLSPKMDLMPRIGLRFSMNLGKNYDVKVYTGADSRTVKVMLNVPQDAVKKIEEQTELPTKVSNKETKEETIVIPKIKRKNGDKVVVIDPGHGGTDYGALRSGINEKDITTDVSLRVAALLRKKGYKVYLTRDEDKTVSLSDRVAFAEGVDPDIFVSIHVNSCQGTEPTGLETHYYHDYSIPLAKTVHSSLVENVNSKDRGLLKSRFYVINHTTMPAILVEIGFISNDAERAEMVSEKRKNATAKGIAGGIINYYEQQH